MNFNTINGSKKPDLMNDLFDYDYFDDKAKSTPPIPDWRALHSDEMLEIIDDLDRQMEKEKYEREQEEWRNYLWSLYGYDDDDDPKRPKR